MIDKLKEALKDAEIAENDWVKVVSNIEDNSVTIRRIDIPKREGWYIVVDEDAEDDMPMMAYRSFEAAMGAKRNLSEMFDNKQYVVYCSNGERIDC